LYLAVELFAEFLGQLLFYHSYDEIQLSVWLICNFPFKLSVARPNGTDVGTYFILNAIDAIINLLLERVLHFVLAGAYATL
jgi:hypothetical protein